MPHKTNVAKVNQSGIIESAKHLERSPSYLKAIGSGFLRSSIEIPNIENSGAYNSELNGKVKEKCMKSDVNIVEYHIKNFESNGLTNGGKIDEMRKYPTEHETIIKESILNIYDNNTAHLLEDLTVNEENFINNEKTESMFNELDLIEDSVCGYSTPYSKRKKKGTRHRRRRGRPHPLRRVVYKNGNENVPVRSNIPAKSIKYMRDIVHTVINSKWRFIILMAFGAHFVFWLIFASIWYALATSYQNEIGDGKEHCVTGTSSFAGLLMMSVETQMTIGYGVRYPSEECPEAILVMIIEIVAGTALSGGLSSLLFTKLIRPNRRMCSVGFSRKASVCLRDGELCLQFRVWDLQNLHLIGSTITAYMLKPIRTLEGELVQNYIHQLKLEQARAFLLWPITVVHVIDSDSPLYEFSAQNMLDYRFEIVVCLTGSSKNMGAVTQSRTSYLSSEIIWGYRFKNVLRYSRKSEAYVIDTENLNTVEQVDTPLCSASRLKEFHEDLNTNLINELSPITTISLSPEISSMTSQIPESSQSSPILNKLSGTQLSYGWQFRKLRMDKKQVYSSAANIN